MGIKEVEREVKAWLLTAIAEAKSSAICEEVGRDLETKRQLVHLYNTEKVNQLADLNFNSIANQITEFLLQKEEELYNMTLASVYKYTEEIIEIK